MTAGDAGAPLDQALARRLYRLVPRSLITAHNRALVQLQEAEARLQQARRQHAAEVPSIPMDPALVPPWIVQALDNVVQGTSQAVEACEIVYGAAQRTEARAQAAIDEALRQLATEHGAGPG